MLIWGVTAEQLNKLANRAAVVLLADCRQYRVQVPWGGMQGTWLWLKQGQQSTAFTLACCLRGCAALWRPVPVTVLSLPYSQFIEAELEVDILSRRVFFYLSAVSCKLFFQQWLQSSLMSLYSRCLFTAAVVWWSVRTEELTGELCDKLWKNPSSLCYDYDPLLTCSCLSAI